MTKQPYENVTEDIRKWRADMEADDEPKGCKRLFGISVLVLMVVVGVVAR